MEAQLLNWQGETATGADDRWRRPGCAREGDPPRAAEVPAAGGHAHHQLLRGRSGRWLHRFLDAIGVTNYVVDSAGVEVKRRARRMKTDRMDMGGLLRLLIRFVDGEHEVWSVVNVPSPEAEDARHLHRELLALQRDRARVATRIKSLLATQGLKVEVSRGLDTRLEQARLRDELPVPSHWPSDSSGSGGAANG